MTLLDYVEKFYPGLYEEYMNNALTFDASNLTRVIFPTTNNMTVSDIAEVNYTPFNYEDNTDGGKFAQEVTRYIFENYEDHGLNKRYTRINYFPQPTDKTALIVKTIGLMKRYKYKWHGLYETMLVDSQYDMLDNVNEIYDETITRTPDLTYTDSNSSIFGQQTSNQTDVHGAQSVENETVYGAQSVENETVYGAQSESGTNVHGAQSTESETVYGAQNVETETVYGAQHEEVENYHDSQHVETENVFGAQTVTDTNEYGQRVTTTETELGSRLDSDGTTDSTHPYDAPSNSYPTNTSSSTHTIGDQLNSESVTAATYTDTLTKALGTHTDTSETDSNSYTDRNETDTNTHTDTVATDTATHTDTTTTDSATYTDTNSVSKSTYTDTNTVETDTHTDTTTTESQSYTDTHQVVDSQHTDSFSGTKTESGEEETVISRRRHGNIGVTTSGQLIEDYRKTHFFDIIQIIANDIINEILDLNFES